MRSMGMRERMERRSGRRRDEWDCCMARRRWVSGCFIARFDTPKSSTSGGYGTDEIYGSPTLDERKRNKHQEKTKREVIKDITQAITPRSTPKPP
jgi:hypothetical protein